MTESKELHEKIDKILQRVESMDSFMPWLIRPQSKEIREDMMVFFKRQTVAANVFLEIDGNKTVSDIAKQLVMKQSNVSREIAKLTAMGIIELKSVSTTTIYQKTKIDKIIRLSEALSKLLRKINNDK